MHKYKIGDRVLLDIRVVEKGNNRKFTSKFQGPWRVIRVYSNGTADITDNTYKVKTVHVNRLKPLYETMLWRDEPEPEILSTLEKRDPFHKSRTTQTRVNDEPETIAPSSTCWLARRTGHSYRTTGYTLWANQRKPSLLTNAPSTEEIRRLRPLVTINLPLHR